MADLSTLSELSPADTDVIAEGATRIRETRLSTKTSVALEHGLAGEHKFPQGNLAGRVAYALGRMYVNTQQRMLNQGIAGSWTVLPAVAFTSFFDASAISLTGSYANITNVGLGIPTGAFIFLISYVELLFTTANASYSISAKHLIDGATAMSPPDQTFYVHYPTATSALPAPFPYPFVSPAIFTTILAEGNHTFALQMKFNGGPSTPTVRNRFTGILAG